jgi:hypothetical protein
MMDFRENFLSAVTEPGSEYANDLETYCVEMMKKQLSHRPELWEKLTPRYPVGCKRVIISDDFYPAIGRENATLETRQIDSFNEKGVLLNDGSELELDAVILATGFRTVDFMHPIKVIGREGRGLSAIWKGAPRALYGVTVESLPNFGMLYGPNTNLGHNSIILMIEAQARYIHALVDTVLRARSRDGQFRIEPRPERVEQFNTDMQEILKSSSYASTACNSWYKTAEGLVTNNWSRTVVEYQKLLSAIQWDDYIISGNGAPNLRSHKRIGRVVEETYLSYKTLGLTVAGLLAIVGGLVLGAPRQFATLR